MRKGESGIRRIKHRAMVGSRKDKSIWQRTERSDSTLRYPAVRFSALQSLIPGVSPGLYFSTFRIPNSEFFRMLHALCVCSPLTRNPHPATRNSQHATRIPQLATRNPQLATPSPQPATHNSQPASRNLQSVLTRWPACLNLRKPKTPRPLGAYMPIV